MSQIVFECDQSAAKHWFYEDAMRILACICYSFIKATKGLCDLLGGTVVPNFTFFVFYSMDVLEFDQNAQEAYL